MKNYLSVPVICLSFLLFQNVFAQDALREAVDSGDIATAKKMVKNGEAEEIYCGKLSPSDAVKIYEKIFKSAPEVSFEQCPSQFSYGYGVKICSNAKMMNACTEVVTYLLNESMSGNTNAIDAFENVSKAVLKTKAFAKPVKEQVDTTMWVACPKKGKDKAACLEECKAQADSLNDEIRKESCDKKPEHFIETTISVSKPSPLIEKVRTGMLEGYWKVPMASAEKFAKIIQSSAKSLSIPDSSIPNMAYVKRWAESHKADSSALPGGQLFRFCTAWQSQVDSLLTSLELETRCPVFEKFTDSRDNQVYKMKDINGVVWFVENLNFAIEEGSMCYDRDEENCKSYGRLYSFDVAQNVCPEGTRLATDADWKALEEYAGGSSDAATKLRSNGGDDFAFSVLFGGYANKSGISTTAGEGAYFWVEKSEDEKRGMARSMFSTDKEVSSISVDKTFSLSVRCIKN